MEGNYFNVVIDIKKKTIANVLIDEIANALPLRLGTRQGYLLSPLLIHIMLEVLDSTILGKKKEGGGA